MHASTLIALAVFTLAIVGLVMALQNQRRRVRTIRRKFNDLEGEEQRMFTFLHDLGLAMARFRWRGRGHAGR